MSEIEFLMKYQVTFLNSSDLTRIPCRGENHSSSETKQIFTDHTKVFLSRG